MRVWDVQSGESVRSLPATGTVLCANNETIFAGSGPHGDQIKLWEADGAPYAVFNYHRGQVNMAHAANGVLYTAGADGVAHAFVIPPAPKSGHLEKKGGGTSLFGRRSWHKRYFILREGKLSYYKVSTVPNSRDKSVICTGLWV